MTKAVGIGLFAAAWICLSAATPQYLDFGSAGSVQALARDSSGNIYAVGAFSSQENPGITRLRAIKLSPAGSILYTYTFPAPQSLNSSGTAQAAAVDSSGALYVVGSAYCDQTTNGAQEVSSLLSWTYGLFGCAFVAKLNPAGTSIQLFSTLGNTSTEIPAPGGSYTRVAIHSTSVATAVALDPAGNIYVTGYTDAQAFPSTADAYQRLGPYASDSDASLDNFVTFVVKIPRSLDSFAYSTFLSGYGGGSSGYYSYGLAIAADASGLATITGSCDRTFPFTAGSYNASANGYVGQFVSRLSADGSSLVWSAQIPFEPYRITTYSQQAFVALEADGSVLVAAASQAPPPPNIPAGYYTVVSIAKLGSSGSQLLASIVLGGSSSQYVTGFALGSQGNLWLSGTTYSVDFPSLPGSLNLGAAYVAELSPGLDKLLRVDRLPNDTATMLALDPTGTPILIGLYGSLLSISPALESQPAALAATDSAATSTIPYVSPGAFVSFYGNALGPTPAIDAAFASPGVLSTTLGGVTVTFDGIPAPLLYAGAAQINAIVPFGVSGKSSTSVTIQNDSGYSASITLPVLPATPFLFTVPGTYDGLPSAYAAALNEDGTINSPSNPAHSGSIVTLFANGAGVFNPPLQDGVAVNSIAAAPVLPVSVYPDGALSQPLPILYAGPAPGQVAGVLQVNCRLPSPGVTGTLRLQVGAYENLAVRIYSVN